MRNLIYFLKTDPNLMSLDEKCAADQAGKVVVTSLVSITEEICPVVSDTEEERRLRAMGQASAEAT